MDAVFEGKQAARMFVDDPDSPTCALMARSYDYFLAGEPSAALRRFLREAPAAPGVFSEFYGYVPLNSAWHEALIADHEGELEVIGRRSFRFPAPALTSISNWRERIPAGIEIVTIDAALAPAVDERLHEFIGLLWGTYERFEELGFGFCALSGDRPVSTAFAGVVSEREANLSVGTDPEFRRLGLAFLCSAACIERGLALGRDVTWDCDSHNLPSGELAAKLGFVEEEPFAELAFPNRAKPVATAEWIALEPRAGVIPWQRVSKT
jgi:RimJ/RimL family protein N-acetyltransferase